MEQSKISSKKDIDNLTSRSKKSLKLPDLTPKATKERTTKPKVNRWKKYIKVRAEISEIETKKTIATINKFKSLFFKMVNNIYKPLTRAIIKGRGLESIK